MTPKLEELILSGDAEYRVQSGFSSGAFTIPCPQGKEIVILDFDFSCSAGFSALIPGLVLFVKFYGVDQKRQNVISFYPLLDRTGNLQMGTYKKNLYFAYNSNCRIDIVSFDNGVFASVDNSVMPSQSKDLPAPGGYGTTIAVARAYEFGAGDFYLPQGLELSGFAPVAGMKNDPFPNIAAGTALAPVTTTSEGFSINIGYVILNKPRINKF